MEMRSKPLEGSFVELLLKIGMGYGDDEFGSFLQRPAIQVDSTVFRDEPMDVVARGDSTRAQVQSRHNLVDTLACSGWHSNDGFAPFGAR